MMQIKRVSQEILSDFLFYQAKYFKSYINFTGRATRKEYIYTAMFYDIFLTVIPDKIILYITLPLLFPGLSVLCRRLHDAGCRGYWGIIFILLSFLYHVVAIRLVHDFLLKIVGLKVDSYYCDFGVSIIYDLVFLLILPGEKGENKYGFSSFESDEILNLFKAVERILDILAKGKSDNMGNIYILCQNRDLKLLKKLFENIFFEKKRSDRVMILNEVIAGIAHMRQNISSYEVAPLLSMELEMLETQLRALPSLYLVKENEREKR